MSSLGSPSTLFLAKKKAYEVERSLRFNKSDLAYLGRTPSSTGNQKVWTWSCWFKRTKLADSSYFISSYGNNDGIAAIYFDNSDRINTYYDTSGSNPYGAVNERRYRDTSAWMHLVWQVDALNTTQRIWINGVEESLSSSLNPPNYAYTMNQSGQLNAIGNAAWYPSGTGSNMYLAECHFSDGYKYTPTDFAETNTITGQWIPKSPSISYGTNGFYLNFSDNSGTTASTLGKDSSGNGNNFTPTNFSVAVGTGNDSLEDTPTNNFPTLNPLYNPVNSTLSEGNLLARGADNFAGSTFLLPKSGKWYVEFSKYGNGVPQAISVTRANTAMTNYNGYLGLADMVQYVSNGELGNRSRGSTSDATNWENDADIVVAAAVDMDNGAVYFARANTWQNSGDPTSGSSKTGAIATDLLTDNNGDHIIAVQGYNGSINYGMYVNFGQRPFTYTPPTGYKSLCSANLPDPTIKLPNKHFNTLLYTGDGSSTRTLTGVGFKPNWTWKKERNQAYSIAHMLYDSVRGLGVDKHLDSSTTAAEGSGNDAEYGYFTGFTSDGFSVSAGSSGDDYVNDASNNYVTWNWNAGDTDGKTYTVKVVSDSGNKYRFDDFGTSAVTLDLAEGGTYIFDQSDSSNAGHPLRFSTTADGTHGGGTEYTTGVTTAGTPGSSGAYTQIVVAASAPNLAYYCSVHSGMGGSVNTNSTLGSSNFDGTVQSTAKVNASAGFSIVNYVGTGQDNTDVTIGHSIGVAPQVVIVKNRDSAKRWQVFHHKLSSGKTILLNSTNAESSYTSYIKQVSSTTFTVRDVDSNDNANVNKSGDNYIAYCFSEVEGYSKFGSYVGNSSDDGTFVFTGFSVAWLMVKRANGSNTNWTILDNKRNTFNVRNTRLFANDSSADSVSSGGVGSVDFLSNGFKARDSHQDGNSSSGTYIYFAFAESPFKNARAR